MAMEDINRRLPFACQDPVVGNHLPSDASKQEKSVIALSEYYSCTPILYEMENGESLNLGPYSQTAQATCLLSQVLEHIADNSMDWASRQLRTEQLDQALQSLLQALLESRGYIRGDCCGPYSVCVRYVNKFEIVTGW
jgi:hypothetical protein